MVFDMKHYKYEDIKSEEDKCWIDGYKLAMEDVNTALSDYINILEDEQIASFRTMQAEIASDFVNYLLHCMEESKDEMIVSVLDSQRD